MFERINDKINCNGSQHGEKHSAHELALFSQEGKPEEALASQLFSSLPWGWASPPLAKGRCQLVQVELAQAMYGVGGGLWRTVGHGSKDACDRRPRESSRQTS